MRQSDGSEILGPNDPRNLVIGIIHVTPGDDRQSVITAITRQEAQERDQIVLDLPAQNRAFKNAVDFEGLRKMASEIEATLVLVVPDKSKIASLARKENFTVYPSLEDLAAAEFPPMEPDEVVTDLSKVSTPPAPVPVIDDDESDHTLLFPVNIPDVSAPPSSPSGNASPGIPPSTPADENQLETPELPTLTLTRPTNVSQPEDEEPPVYPVPQAGAGPLVVDADEIPDTPQATNYLPVPSSSNRGVLVPANSLTPNYYEPPDPPRRRSLSRILITAVVIIVLIGIGILFYRPILDLIFPPQATITVTPDSQLLKHAYQITAVLGVPDPTRDQVDARALYATSQTESQTVKASGTGHTSGQQAQGTLTFYNVSPAEQTIPANTVFIDSHNIAVANTNTVTLPAFDPAQNINAITADAHTINAGVEQNIPAYDFDHVLCCNNSVYVSNSSPFTGGENARTYAYVQQSDIDAVTKTLEPTLDQQATSVLQSQMRSNEQPVAAPRCESQVTSDHQAGEIAANVTVSLIANCLGEVYDRQAVQILAARKLAQDASSSPGAAYAPVGDIISSVAQAVPDPRGNGNVILLVNAQGVWAYQFSASQRTRLANLIAGKSSLDAQALLRKQPGVHSAAITLTGSGADTVPGNTAHITVKIEAVQGLHA